jgi:hypothetical protein
MKRRETKAQRKTRLKKKLQQHAKSNGDGSVPPPDYEEDEVTDVIDLVLDEYRETHERCQKETRAVLAEIEAKNGG